MTTPTAELGRQLALCRAARNPMDRFNSVVLRRGAYWKAQRDIGRALNDPTVRRVCVKSGHMTGKSYSAGGFALGWLSMYADSGVAAIGPSLGQVRRAVWKEFRKARNGSPLLRDVGRLGRNPMELEYDEGWLAIGLSGTEPERLQGFHPSGPVLVIVDEASGVNDPDVNQALNSLKPLKRLDISNPLKAHGEFYEACQRAADDPSIRVITIPSTASPDIGLEHSPRGLADAAWLRGMVLDYGADSQTYKVRVGAEFPDGGDDLLVPGKWLDECGAADHVEGGRARLAMDLGLGRGGDDTTHLVRDDNGILHFEASKFRDFDSSAELARRLADRFGIPPSRISWDAAGIGAEFDHRLRGRGLVGCVPYVGATKSKSLRFDNLRSASHFAMRRRLDPTRRNDDGTARPVFAIPREFMGRFRRECRELTFENLESGRMALRSAEDVAESLRHSPDYSVTLAQSFAFPT